jgi:Pilus formation protein N terminal region
MRRYKMALRCLTVTVILLGSFTSASRAQENPCSTRGGVTTCTLNPGFVATYLLSRAPNTIAVGDPKVADAAIGPGNKLVLTAKKSGTTNVIAFDSTGEEILQATVEVLAPPPPLSEDTIGSGSATRHQTTRSLVLAWSELLCVIQTATSVGGKNHWPRGLQLPAAAP